MVPSPFPSAPDVAGAGGYNWISGPLPGPAAETNGPFDYQTHFTVNSTGAISITGMLRHDQVTQIEINGVVATTTGLPTPDQGYSSLYPFTASVPSGGILGPNGNNTLDFIVSNTHLSARAAIRN